MAKSRARKLADIIVGAGVDIDGNLTFDGGSTSADLTFADNDKANFGDASDLQIFHSGTDSIIKDSGIGGIKIDSNYTAIRSADGSETSAKFLENGAVELYHDNSKKSETTSTGIDVTGTVVSDGLTVDGNALINRATFSDTQSDPALEISARTDTSNLDFKFIDNDGSVLVNQVHHKSEYYSTDGTQVSAKVRTEYADVSGGMNYVISTSAAGITVRDRLKIASNGDIRFYEDTGTDAKFFWDASAERLGIGTTSPGEELHIETTGGATAGIQLSTTGGTVDRDWKFIATAAEGTFFIQDATASVNRVAIDTSGNVGIGTTSPSDNLHIYDSAGGATLKIESNLANAYDSSKIQLLGGNLSTSEILLGDASSATVGRIIYRHNGNSLAFDVNSSERMRLDSSGNLLVGKTSLNDNLAGFQTSPSGETRITRSGGLSLVLNRKTSDGEILDFRKDGTTVGSAGCYSGSLFIGGGDVGIGFYQNADALVPFNPAANTRDAAIDLGMASSGRYKDLHLSGKISTSTTTGLSITADSSNRGILNLSASQSYQLIGGTYYGYTGYKTGGYHRWFGSDGSEDMRLDSSGNLLVGTTSGSGASAPDNSSTASDAGVRLSPTGFIGLGANQAPSGYFNRIGNDGDIVKFNKDGTTVGSIGSNSGAYLFIASANNVGGIGFYNNSLRPVQSNGGHSDADQDLGVSSVRWRHLYLSGTVNAASLNIDGGTIKLDGNYPTGSNNVALGNAALDSVTSGSQNVAIGRDVLTALTTGTHNSAVGSAAMESLTSGQFNVGLGSSAAGGTTTGEYNVAIGHSALISNTTASNNVAVGGLSLDANTTGSSNTAVGMQSLSANTTGTKNVAVGANALDASTTASENTAVGYSAAGSITSGARNVALGQSALAAGTTAYHNVAIGYASLDAITDATRNVAVGYQSLSSSTASYNTAMGWNSMVTNTTGQYNVAMGTEALSSGTTAANSVAVGYRSLRYITSGNSNVAIGHEALDANTTASNNTAVGASALGANTTGVSNVAVGTSALDANTTASGNVAIGKDSLGTNVGGSRNVAIGNNALGSANPSTASDTYNVAIGYSSGVGVTTGIYNTFLGGLSGDAVSSGQRNVAVGMQALSSSTTASNNTAVGYQALTGSTAGDNTAFGSIALRDNTSGVSNTAVGYASLSSNHTGNRNTAVGQFTLYNNTGSENTALGWYALLSNTSGTNNTAVGRSSLQSNTTGTNNTGIGYGALNVATTASFNTALGRSALGATTTGINNIAIGRNASLSSTTASNNTIVGTTAGDALTTGSSNVALGYGTLTTETAGQWNVAIGRDALSQQNTTTAANTYNTAVGGNAMKANTTGTYNTAIGGLALDSNNTGAKNTAIGLSALTANTTGLNNVAVGSYALDANTTGTGSTAVGLSALSSNTLGGNTALGYYAATSNTTGSGIVALGNQALYYNTTGSGNVAVGESALVANTTSSLNTAVGFQALSSQAAGTNVNTAIGYRALAAGNNSNNFNNTAVGGYALENNQGTNNTAVGRNALIQNTTGIQNTAVGANAGDALTTGGRNVAVGYGALSGETVGQYSTAVGYLALTSQSNTTAVTAYNTAVGYSAGVVLNTGINNTLVGGLAGAAVTTGANNTTVGKDAGLTVTTGAGNTYIGYGAGPNSSTGTGNQNTTLGYLSGNAITSGAKNTIIGAYTGNQGGLDIRNASNHIVLSDGDGNPRVIVDSAGMVKVGTALTSGIAVQNTDQGAQITEGGRFFTCSTDHHDFNRTNNGDIIRFRHSANIVGSISITSSATAYNTSSDHRLKENVVAMTGATARLKQLAPKRFNFIAESATTVDGFLAHEVQSVVPEAITGTHNEVDDDGNAVYQGIDQSKLVPLLVATIQELEARIAALESN